MANLTITIPDAQAVRVRDGFAYANGYTDTVLVPQEGGLPVEVPNPETKNAFLKRIVIRFIKQSVKQYEADRAADIARQSAAADAEANVNLT